MEQGREIYTVSSSLPKPELLTQPLGLVNAFHLRVRVRRGLLGLL